MLRVLILFSIVVPLAVYIGYLLSNPYSSRGMMEIGLTVGLLVSPLLLKDHHVLPFMSWYATMSVWFLPGSPPFWVLFSALSVGLIFLTGSLHRRNVLLPVPSVAVPLICLMVVIGVTAELTGGIAGEALGSERFGGKSYMLLFGAIIGFFALSSHQIPLSKAHWYVTVFFLSGLTAAVSDVILVLGSKFYFLFAFFSPEVAMYQAEGEIGFGNIIRLAGVATASQSVCLYLLARHGIRGLAGLRHWWRGAIFIVCFGAALLGGFRSSFVTLALLISFQFIFEKLLRTVVFPATVGVIILLSICLLPFLDRMPLAVQRSLSFLPVHVDAAAALDAEGTAEWRWEMWKAVLPDVPRYLFLGKGYLFSSTDMYLTQEANRRGYVTEFDSMIVIGGYHNGPLTTIIPFGIWGALCFAWFCWVSIRYLYRKKEHGRPELRTINTFLLSLFCSTLLFFLTIYGQFNLDLRVFAGIMGLSIALNRGAENPKLSPTQKSRPRVAGVPTPAFRPRIEEPQPVS